MNVVFVVTADAAALSTAANMTLYIMRANAEVQCIDVSERSKGDEQTADYQHHQALNPVVACVPL